MTKGDEYKTNADDEHEKCETGGRPHGGKRTVGDGR